MDNLYVKKSNMSFYFLICFLGLILHIVYQIVFNINKVDNFVRYYNIFSILVFFLASLILKKRDNYLILFIASMEVTLFSIVTVVKIGWIYEFQLWIIAISVMEIIVPFKKYKKYFYALAVLNAIVYSILYIYVFTEFDSTKIFTKDVFFCITNVIATFFLIFFAERVLKVSNIVETYNMKQEYEKMEFIANIDELTGIINRRKMKDILSDNNVFVGKKESEFYISFADIDNFKNINDSYGHDAGDYVLKYVASFLKKEIGDKNTVSRWGGEEFLMLFSNPITKDEVCEKLEYIRDTISKNELKYDDNIIKFTMTFGVVSSNECKNVYDMTKKADELMYIGKNTGKNKVVF